jgi:hypothetical protein
MPVATTLSVWQGTELTPGSGHTWTVSSTVQEEVQAAFRAGLADGTLADATSWSFELASGIAFRVNMLVKFFSMNCISISTPSTRAIPQIVVGITQKDIHERFFRTCNCIEEDMLNFRTGV